MSFDSDGARLIAAVREGVHRGPYGPEFSVGAGAAVLALLDALTPPPTNETPEEIADAWRNLLIEQGTIVMLGAPNMTWYDQFRMAYLLGIHAGIQAGWESWEPENAPGLAEMPLSCAECGTTEATTWVVTYTSEDRRNDRTEVCRSCDDALTKEAASS